MTIKKFAKFNTGIALAVLILRWFLEIHKDRSHDFSMRFLFFIFSFLFVCSSSAFINIESLRQDIEKGFNGSSGVTVGGSSGNVDVFGLGVNSQNIYKSAQREYIVIGKYQYGEANGLKNNNTGNFHLRYAQGFAKGLFWEAFTQAEFNEFQDLKLRTLLGGGLRMRLLKDNKNSIFLGLGTFYEDEEIDSGIDQANFRGNIYLSFRSLLAQQFETVLVAYYQPNYNVINDYRLQLTAGFESKITETLQLVNNFSYSSDTRPPAGIEEEDFTYSVVFNLSY